MKIHHRTVLVLREALKQNRQLTLAEQMQAHEVLAVLRRDALALFHVAAPIKTPQPGDDPKDTLAVALRRRGLHEVAVYVYDKSTPLDDDTRALAAGLLLEASRDFGKSAAHNRGTPPQVAAAANARRERSKEDSNRADLEDMRDSFDALALRCVALEERMADLESRMSDAPAVADSASPAADAASSKGQ